MLCCKYTSSSGGNQEQLLTDQGFLARIAGAMTLLATADSRYAGPQVPEGSKAKVAMKTAATSGQIVAMTQMANGGPAAFSAIRHAFFATTYRPLSTPTLPYSSCTSTTPPPPTLPTSYQQSTQGWEGSFSHLGVVVFFFFFFLSFSSSSFSFFSFSMFFSFSLFVLAICIFSFF